MTGVTFNPNHRGVGEMLRSDFMQAAMLEHAERIKAVAEATAPVGRPSEDEHAGRYKASFHVRVHARGGATGDRAEAIVSNDSPEARWVEWGTRDTDGHHTLARAAFQRL